MKDMSRHPMQEKLTPVEGTSTHAADAGQRWGEIPKFDLANDIMAEHRKITATRRKAPGKETEPSNIDKELEPVGHATEQLIQPLPEQQIIAEIVARDLRKLCRM